MPLTLCEPMQNIKTHILSLPLILTKIVTLFFFFFFFMAPKRRSAKKGETRMDAALDAMALYGFPKQLVRTTVQSLLKVYGGNEGWIFLEDSGYTVLIDALLEKQADPSPQVGLIEANPDGSNEAMDTVSATSGTGNQLLVEAASETPPIKGVDTVSATSDIGSELPFKSVDISSVTRKPANQLLIEAVGETPIKAETASECLPVGDLALGKNHGSTSPHVTRLSNKRRRPCYGWISNDDDEEEELIQLAPAPWLSISHARENNGGKLV